MQENTVFPCIRDLAPYLSHPLKLDNLPPICKDVSEEVLPSVGGLARWSLVVKPRGIEPLFAA